MEKKLKMINIGDILYCENCNVKLQAGPRWVLFCPKCELVEKGFKLPESIMSCVHCDKPLVIELTEDSRIVGRCHTDNCGDCFSMQDLCLIKKP